MTESPRAVFDEQHAVEELDRLQQAIHDARRRRRQIGAEFDDFVNSLRRSARADDDTDRDRTASRPKPAGPSARVLAARGTYVDSREVIDAAPPTLGNTAGSRRTPRRRLRRLGLAAVAAGILTAGLLLARASRIPLPASSVTDQQTTSLLGRTGGTGSSTGLPAPASLTANNRGVQGELTTLRPVWVRVLADGERVLERELPAAARVPLRADQTLVIRIGDAGAVRLSIDGRDQHLLGQDGEVITRTFSARQPSGQ